MVSRLSVVTRLIAVFVLAVLALIWIGRPVGAVEPAPLMGAMAHPYTYDAPKYDSPGVEATSERGPPTACRSCTNYDVGRWSHGASPRSDASPGRSTTTYAYRAALVQGARATTTTGGRVGLPDGDSSSLERSGGAAKSGVPLGPGVTTRKINWRPNAADPNWGLTGAHVNKHLFGNSKYALNKIDPGGNADIWRGYMQDLASRPATGTTSNGMLDIVGTFPRTGGGGSFQFGIRLAPGSDGSFDLITLLTKQ